MRRNCSLGLVGLLVGAGGCHPEATSTTGFGVLAVSAVHGRVTTDVGTPLANVVVRVDVPPREGYGYAIAPVETDRDGQYRYVAARMTAPIGASPSPDTVRVVVSALVSDPRYAPSPSRPLVLRDSVLLTFVPTGAVPASARVEFRVVTR